MKYDIFISYSSKDQKVVEAMCAYLEQHKIRCFVAYRDIPKGVVWARAIVEALDESKMMVVVFSEEFNLSDQVDREIELASEDKKPILTFRISDAMFSGAKKYYLKNINWIDAFPHPESVFDALLDNICKLLGGPSVQDRKPKSVAAKPVERTWKVGDYYDVDGKKGVVFWVDATGKHGKITSLDQDQLRWCTFNQFKKRIAVGTSSKINGKENTDKVMIRPDADEYPAFTWCRSKGNDWYLPAIDELELLVWNDNVRMSVSDTLEQLGYARIYSKGVKFKDAYFWWSSTECKETAATGAMGINNRGIGVDGYGKPNPDAFVRAVCAF